LTLQAQNATFFKAMPTIGAASDYLENIIMKWLGRNTNMPSAPGTVFLALFDAVPNDDGSGATEFSAGNYARLSVSTGTAGTGSGSSFNAPTGTNGTITNAINITFPMCSGADWGVARGWALFDAPTGGNMLVRGDISPDANITIGYIFVFLAPNWLIKLD
jgi:hypothetical protein